MRTVMISKAIWDAHRQEVKDYLSSFALSVGMIAVQEPIKVHDFYDTLVCEFVLKKVG